MGLLRKLRSAAALGAADGTSDKEGTAASTRKAKHAPEKGNRLLQEQNRLMRDRLMRAHFFGF